MSRKTGKSLTRLAKNPQQRIKKNFTPSTSKYVVYSNMPTLPMEFDTVVVTSGVIRSAAATASIVQTVVLNSLLQAAGAVWVAVGQSQSLPNMAKAYAQYRVTAIHAEVTAVSRSTQTIYTSILVTSEDNGYTSASSFAFGSSANPNTKFFALPGTNNTPNVKEVKMSHKLDLIAGTPNLFTDADYAGPISTAGAFTDPAKVVNMTFYCGPATGSFTASTSPEYNVKLVQYVQFFDRRN